MAERKVCPDCGGNDPDCELCDGEGWIITG